MKKGKVGKVILTIILVIVICALVCACVTLGLFARKYYNIYKADVAAQEEVEAQKLADEEAKAQAEAEHQKFLDENVLDNKIPLSLYIDRGGVFTKADTHFCDWTRDEILGIFYVFPSTEQEIRTNNYENTFEQMWAQYNTEGYKIGYQIKLTMDTGEVMNRTMKLPIYVNDEIFSHIQLYMYDDVTYYPGRRYYHMSPEEMVPETLLTSLKLVGYKETKGVNGPIELTVFTYNGDEDFDSETGEYLGNSKFTSYIYREQV